MRHPLSLISGYEKQVRHTNIVVVGAVRSLVVVAGSGSSFLIAPRVHGSTSFRCGRSSRMFEVSVSAVFALSSRRSADRYITVVLGNDCSCMLFDS